jgi:3-deoxy-D-manno-octulosonic-acid transferase
MATAQNRARLVDRLAGTLLARYVGWVRRTSRGIPEMEAVVAEAAEKNFPCIVGMWHGEFMLLPLIKPRDLATDVMLARHGDAEFLGEALKQFDMQLIRGAGAAGRGKDRGGAHAYRAAIQALRDGRAVAMTADVPGGQARKAGLGIVMAAKQSGRPIVPVAIATKRYFALNTWSRMTINLPYSSLGFAAGSAVHVPHEATSEDLERYRHAVEAGLNAATELAYARAGGDAERATPGGAITKRPEPGLWLKGYRSVTSYARPIAPLLLGLRERRGKEEPQRRSERLGQPSVARPAGRLVWFHAASVGETNAILPLMSALAQERPMLSFLLTTGTVTSAQLAAQRLGPRAVHQYAPLDAPEYVRSFLDHWRPDLGVFTESEIWPNLILESAARDIPLALVNARMTKRSFRRWRRNPRFANPLFSRFSIVLAQNEALARRFATLGARSTVPTGNLKADAPAPVVDNAEFERLRPMLQGRPLLIAASTHDGEDEIIADAHRQLAANLPGLCTMIAPRHPQRGAAIVDMLRGQGLRTAQRSLGELPGPTVAAYVFDTIGELGTLYKLASVAFIGGSLVNRGGHNPIEAMQHGAAVLVGPHRQNFADAYGALIANGGAIVVQSAEDIANVARKLLLDEAELASVRTRGSAALATISGALPRTIEALLRYLPSEEGLARAS